MTTALVSVFLFLHGFAHLPVWLPRTSPGESFDPRHSWALAAAGVRGPRIPGTAGIRLASVTTMLYVMAGAAAATQANGWGTAAARSCCCSTDCRCRVRTRRLPRDRLRPTGRLSTSRPANSSVRP